VSLSFVELGQIADINPRLPKDTDETQKVSFLTMAAVSENGEILSQEERILSETKKGFTYFERDDVLLAKITPCFENGKAVLVDKLNHQIGFGSTEFHVLRPYDDALDARYLFYMVWNDRFRFLGQSAMKGAAGQKRVSADFLKEFRIPLPPLAEQKRIAAILDKADSLRRKRQQAIQLADQFLRAVFLDMFGDPMMNPKGWEVVKIGSVVDCIVPGRDKPKSFTGSIPWVTTNDLCHLGYTYEPKQFIGLTKEEIKEVKAKVVPKASVIMTCVGDLGVLSIAGREIVINQQLHAFLPSSKINNAFLMYALSFQKKYMLSMASNTTVPYMNKTICNSIPLTVPPIEAQHQFGKIHDKIQVHLTEVRHSQVKCNALFNSLTQKAFAGEL
jgi:type I restriction enzyme S subunit